MLENGLAKTVDSDNIEREYNGVYEKRHQRIEEKKAVLLVQERARERKVTQPEEEPQAEEIAA